MREASPVDPALCARWWCKDQRLGLTAVWALCRFHVVVLGGTVVRVDVVLKRAGREEHRCSQPSTEPKSSRVRYFIALQVGGSGPKWSGSVPRGSDGSLGRTVRNAVAVVCKGEVNTERGHGLVLRPPVLSGCGPTGSSGGPLRGRERWRQRRSCGGKR